MKSLFEELAGFFAMGLGLGLPVSIVIGVFIHHDLIKEKED